MTRCRKCDNPITVSQVIKWINSGIGSIKCGQCENVIASSKQLFIIYTIAAIVCVIGINFSSEISAKLSSFGLTELLVVFIIIIIAVLLIYSVALLTVKRLQNKI